MAYKRTRGLVRLFFGTVPDDQIHRAYSSCSKRVYALEHRLAGLKAYGHNVLVQDPLEQVMHWHFVAMISRKLCRKRAQGGWRC
jgi:hypothetical protein